MKFVILYPTRLAIMIRQQLLICLLVASCSMISSVKAQTSVIAGWDVEIFPDGGGEGNLVGSAVLPGVTITSGNFAPDGNDVDLNGVLDSFDGDFVGSNDYRGVFAVENWVLDPGLTQGTPTLSRPSPADEFDVDRNLTFSINSIEPLQLDTFELVVRRQAVNTPINVREVFASFSTDGETFTDYLAPDTDGVGNTDLAQTRRLVNNVEPGDGNPNGMGTPPPGTRSAHKIWDVSTLDTTGVTELWVRVQGRSFDNRMQATRSIFIDDRGDLDTATPLAVEANTNNPLPLPTTDDLGNPTFFPKTSDDGFDVVLTGLVLIGQPGDFNGDGVVNTADYTVWRDNLGATEDGDVLSGNGNGGTVDATDYALWRENFGASQGMVTQATATVPEPATIVIILSLISAAAVLCYSDDRQHTRLDYAAD